MRNLLNLLQKYSSVFIFLLFQTVCFSFIFSNYNTYHHVSFATSSNSLIGGIYEINAGISDYFHLKKSNEYLVNENLNLKKKLLGYTIKIGDHYAKVNDTLYFQQYDFIDAKVINSSINRQKNSITLNRGKISGAAEKMGVIGPKGVIGITVSSSSNYSTVIPIINELFEMSVRHKKTKSFGMLKWTPNNTWQTATMVDVPNYIKIQPGDTIESRGADGFFPEGIMVGTALSSNNVSGTSYQEIVVQLAEDFSSIYNVTIIKNITQEEQNNIELEK